MGTSSSAEAGTDLAPGRLMGVVGVAFTTIVLLTAIAYTVILAVVNWAAVDVLAYPVQGVAGFAVISGAILTIAIIVPTALVTMNKTA